MGEDHEKHYTYTPIVEYVTTHVYRTVFWIKINDKTELETIVTSAHLGHEEHMRNVNDKIEFLTSKHGKVQIHGKDYT